MGWAVVLHSGLNCFHGVVGRLLLTYGLVLITLVLGLLVEHVHPEQRSEDTTDDRSHPVYVVNVPVASSNSWTKGARGVHRAARKMAGGKDSEDHGKADGDRRDVISGARVLNGVAEDRDHESKRGDDLDEDGLDRGDVPNVVATEVARAVAGRWGQCLEEQGTEDGTNALASDVNNGLDKIGGTVGRGFAKLAASKESEGDGRVQVATGNVSGREHKNHDGKAERERDWVQPTANGDGRTATGEDEQEYTNGLRRAAAEKSREVGVVAHDKITRSKRPPC